MNKISVPLAAATFGGPTLTWLDWLAIAFYFTVLFCVAWWVVKRRKDTAADYFLAGRNLGWWVIGPSIFASNIGSEHIVGLAGSGAADGVAMAHYELHAWCLLVLAWVFVPFYARSLVFTMPEFLERRFSAHSRYVLSIVSLITFVVSKIAVGIFAGGVVFNVLWPDVRLNLGGLELNSFWIGSFSVIILTGLYTALGGMRAVAYNDAVQVVVLISGSALLTLYGLYKLGDHNLFAGWTELRRQCGSDMFNLWKPLNPAGVQPTWAPVLQTAADGHTVLKQAWYFNTYYPWLGMLFCAPIIGLWYWCTDQYIVQRALGAPNEQTARRGSIFAGFLKLFPVYLFIIPGLICYALAKSYLVPGLAGGTRFSVDDFQGGSLASLAAQLHQPTNSVAQFLAAQLAPDTRQLLAARAADSRPQELKAALAKDFTRIVQSGPVYDAQRFAGVALSLEAKRARQLLERKEYEASTEKDPKRQAELAQEAHFLRQRLNKLVIEDAFPRELELDRLLARDGKGNPRGSQGAFPMMVKHLLPPGLRGIVVAGLLSALMGSLAGVFNACSTLFTVDLYEKWKPGASQHQIVRTGRIATTTMVIIALLWIPVVQGAHNLYNYLQSIQGYLAPPIFIVFFFGVFWKRLNAQGCLWAMIVGFALGLFRMFVDTPVTLGLMSGYKQGTFLWVINHIYFQYFSVFIALVSAVVMVAVSYATRQPDYGAIRSLTFGTATAEDKARTRASWHWNDVAASALVLGVIIAGYLYFRG
jgi:SSS family transporter